MKKRFSAFLVFSMALGGVQAQEVYGNIGSSGLTLGLSHSLSTHLMVRVDYAGGINVSKNGREEGVDYAGKLKVSRFGAFADYFPSGSGFRATAGLTLNDTGFQLNSRGGAGTINGKPVNLTGNYFNVGINQPKLTPYIGIGYGHKPAKDTGWGFNADLGLQLGKFKTTVDTNLVSTGAVQQSDVDAEVAKVRDAVNKLRFYPVVSLGANYRFN